MAGHVFPIGFTISRATGEIRIDMSDQLTDAQELQAARWLLKLADMCKDHNKEDEHHDEKTVAGAC